MNTSKLINRLTSEFTAVLGRPVEITRYDPAGGGCINSALRVYLDDGATFFVKWNSCAPANMFGCEAEGLLAMQKATSLRVPTPILVGEPTAETPAFLVLEDLANPSRTQRRVSRDKFDEELAAGLAEMHRFCGPAFGFYHDNYIGTTPQSNEWLNSWVEFFRSRRLEHMVKLLCGSGKISSDDAKLWLQFLNRLDDLLVDAEAQPVLLHGDLWGGNVMCDSDGKPALIDPACYFGHREADLAMTELFGGFSPHFYKIYGEILPLSDGYRERFAIYNLYHLLNHAYLFGGGYLHQAMSIMRRYIR
ncbi:MAG: fructosamine kinase family protein [Candidatus Sumerlaeaceae bacterium]